MSSNLNERHMHLHNIGMYLNKENKVIELDWRRISLENLSDEFIEKYQDCLDWRVVTARFCYRDNFNQSEEKEFIEKYQDKVDWRYISGYVKLTEELIEIYMDKIYWKEIY